MRRPSDRTAAGSLEKWLDETPYRKRRSPLAPWLAVEQTDGSPALGAATLDGGIVVERTRKTSRVLRSVKEGKLVTARGAWVVWCRAVKKLSRGRKFPRCRLKLMFDRGTDATSAATTLCDEYYTCIFEGERALVRHAKGCSGSCR